MAIFNPISYTSRTFESILQDINDDDELIDKPNWFKRLIAGVGDVVSMWNNAAANNFAKVGAAIAGAKIRAAVIAKRKANANFIKAKLACDIAGSNAVVAFARAINSNNKDAAIAKVKVLAN